MDKVNRIPNIYILLFFNQIENDDFGLWIWHGGEIGVDFWLDLRSFPKLIKNLRGFSKARPPETLPWCVSLALIKFLNGSSKDKPRE